MSWPYTCCSYIVGDFVKVGAHAEKGVVVS